MTTTKQVFQNYSITLRKINEEFYFLSIKNVFSDTASVRVRRKRKEMQRTSSGYGRMQTKRTVVHCTVRWPNGKENIYFQRYRLWRTVFCVGLTTHADDDEEQPPFLTPSPSQSLQLAQELPKPSNPGCIAHFRIRFDPEWLRSQYCGESCTSPRL